MLVQFQVFISTLHPTLLSNWASASSTLQTASR